MHDRTRSAYSGYDREIQFMIWNVFRESNSFDFLFANLIFQFRVNECFLVDENDLHNRTFIEFSTITEVNQI
jgi:hypothetical protein